MNTTPSPRFVIRDHSGRGVCAEWTLDELRAQWCADDLGYSADPDDELSPTLSDWLDSAELFDQFDNVDEHWTITRIG
jgi:hypothetical protein